MQLINEREIAEERKLLEQRSTLKTGSVLLVTYMCAGETEPCMLGVPL